MSPPDPSLGAEDFDEDEAYEDEAYEDDAAIYVGGDGPAPAASLTSIRLTRRRSPANPRSSARARTPEPRERPAGTPHRGAGRPADPPQRPAATHRTGNIVDYWTRLRAGRSYPTPAELDAELITATWPNAILLRRHDGESGLRAAALYKPEVDPAKPGDPPFDLSPMIVEWMLTLAEHTVRSGEPLAEIESFERPGGTVRYAACALPLSENQVEVDHVLCYLRVVR